MNNRKRQSKYNTFEIRIIEDKVNHTKKFTFFENGNSFKNENQPLVLENKKIENINFREQEINQEFYKNSFAKFYNDITLFKKKPKAKIKNNHDVNKQPVKTFNTILVKDSLPLSLINQNSYNNSNVSEPSLLIKSVSSLYLDTKVENLYLKESKRHSSKQNERENLFSK